MRYILNLILSLFFIFHNQILSAQNRSGNVWCYSSENQLDFNTGVPTVSGSPLLNGGGGSASIADSATGQLLFYTDGVSVWDRSNTQMPGNTSSLGAPPSTSFPLTPALIVPMPGASKKYYIFTTGAAISFTVIDMSLRSGLGDVAQQPHVLLADTCARITGTFMAGENGTWVVVHLLFSNAFYAYPVTQAGVGTPVISNQGDVDTSDAYLKISPDGSMICAFFNTDHTTYVPAHAELFRFNNSTGMVSPPFIFIDPDYGPGLAGLSFSPNSRLLYVGLAEDNIINQYDLYAGDDSAILASNYQITTPYTVASDGYPAAMQIASNQKIYVSVWGSYFNTWLDAIANPNVYGSGCNYSTHAVTVTNITYGILPNFIDHVFVPDSVPPVAGYITVQAASCIGNCSGAASATAFYGYPPYTYRWQPGNLSTDTIGNLCAGTYYLTVTDSIGAVFTDSVQFSALDTPQVAITGGTYGCPTTYLCASYGNDYSYRWPSGQTSQCIYVANSGSYVVTVTNSNGCPGRSTPLSFVAYNPPTATGKVAGDTLEALTNDSVTYQWSYNYSVLTGATQYFYDSMQAGFYTVLITDTDGCTTELYFGPFPIGGIQLVIKDLITVYPNPSFSSGWQLSVDESLLGSPMELYDENGKCVYKSKIITTNSSLEPEVAKGIYILYIHAADQVVIRKLIRM